MIFSYVGKSSIVDELQKFYNNVFILYGALVVKFHLI